MGEKIYVSHVNIRLSISLLLFKLVFLELVSSLFVIFLHTSFFVLDDFQIGAFGLDLFNIPLYIFLAFLKIILTWYIILQWLNEYYEITQKVIYHRRGLIFKKEEKYPLEQVALIEVTQNMLGKIFNYGTISLYDRRRTKYADMYLIHNPLRYAKIVEEQLEIFSEKKNIIRERLIEEDKYDISEDEY